MKAYQLDILNFYINETECRNDGFGNFLIPGGCVITEPPKANKNEIQYWNEEEWEIKPDFSGILYYSKIDKSEKRFQRGEKFNDSYTDLVPPVESYIIWKDNGWNVDEDLKKQFELNNCKSKAKELIFNCDWSVLPDVNIYNRSEFESYRAILRDYILNPVENPDFPTEPVPKWIFTTKTMGDNNG
jgi:hypothetical protein